MFNVAGGIMCANTWGAYRLLLDVLSCARLGTPSCTVVDKSIGSLSGTASSTGGDKSIGSLSGDMIGTNAFCSLDAAAPETRL